MTILLLGGSKSGKSLLAQSLCRDLSNGCGMVYWATMEPMDDEDRDRIARHRAERAGWGFETVECGHVLDRVALPPESTVLFDSATALLANEMFGASHVCDDPAAANRATDELLALSARVANFVCIADDLGRDGAVYDAGTEAFRRGLALLCRRLAARFDSVREVVAGIPSERKPSPC